jgi:two-component system sensor histidine kinase/response regulator
MENILIVDDTPDNLRLLSVILGDRGYKIRKALNGQTAIKTVQTLAPDLILLDINMPEMNGYEVCQLLKTDAQTQEIPVIFISALDDVLDKVKAFHVSHAQAISIGRSVLERMESSCDRQLKLINSLVETQQFDVWGIPLQCQPLHLAYLTQDLIAEWQPLLAQNQAILDNRIALELPLVYADRDRLWRVLDNLIANAIKHNFPGVKIIVDAEVVKLPADTSLDAGNSMIRCTVTDNGSGINPEQVEDLFELYRRGKSVKRTAGLGLGLYLCRQIINAHQGEIGVETSANQGAQFWFTLPVVR